MKKEEHHAQCALIQWARLQEKTVPELAALFAIPNGGKRGKVTAALLKKEGVKAGVPDLFLAMPRNGEHGLFIEMKSPTGRLTSSQKEMKELLTNAGYTVAVCRSVDDGIKTINQYLTKEDKTES